MKYKKAKNTMGDVNPLLNNPEKDRQINISIFATHPIQYYVPWFRSLSEINEYRVTVYYCMIPDENQQGVGFGVKMQWDLPLLSGYKYIKLDNIARTPSLSNFWGCIGIGIIRQLRRSRPQLVIITGWNSFFLIQALFAAKLLGIKVLMRGESNAIRNRGFSKLLFLKIITRMSDGFLYIGTSNKRFYELCGVISSKLFYAPYFVDNNYLQSTIGHNRKSTDASPCVFLFVGKFIPKKRPQDFVAAIIELKKQGYMVEGLMVGTGELEKEIANMIRLESAPIKMVGFVNQSKIHECYEASSCFVLPSDEGETWGLVVNEAMLFGLPVVVSNKVGCSEDLVLNGVTGYSYNCGDTNDLVDKLILILRDGVNSRKMGENARKRILEEYSVERTTIATVNAVNSLI